MHKPFPILAIIFIILIVLLFIGFPIEFKEYTSERIARGCVSLSIVLLFCFLFIRLKKLKSGKIKAILLSVTILLLIPYLLLVIYNISFALSKNGAINRWKDLTIHEDKNGHRIVYQMRETSGSIYDYRFRKIFYENNSIRISINCNFNTPIGWTNKD